MANQVIQKKKISKVKGKKKWAKQLDAQELVQKSEKQHKKQMKKQELLKSQAVGFELDVGTGDSKNQPLAKDRFKKKNDELFMNPKTLRRIEKKAYNKTRHEEQMKNKQDQNIEIEEELEDAWESENKPKKLLQEQGVKRIVTPGDGLSYNPSAKAFEQHQQTVIEDEMKKDQVLIDKTLKRKAKIDQKNKKKLSKNPKMKQQQLEAKARKQERQLNHQFLTIKKINKEIDQDNKDKETNRKNRQEIEEAEKKNQSELGIVGKGQGKRISSKKYQMKIDLVDEQQIPDKLSSINMNENLVRDQFDSIYRAGYLEQRKKAKASGSRVDARKVYGRNRNIKEEDSWMLEDHTQTKKSIAINN